METTSERNVETPVTIAPAEKRKWLVLAGRILITAAVPVLLTLFSVRLVMTPLFLQIEYNRPGFPEDTYGLTTVERLEYAPYAVEYLLNDSDISYLGDLTFPNGSPLFNARELQHMEDVKVVTRNAYLILIWGGLVAIGVGFLLWLGPNTRQVLRKALFSGSILTLSLILAIIIAAVVAWDYFFTTFHQLFFESGTWRFAYSDTLIRLFPEQFWFDAAIAIGGMTILWALTILFITWRWKSFNFNTNQA